MRLRCSRCIWPSCGQNGQAVIISAVPGTCERKLTKPGTLFWNLRSKKCEESSRENFPIKVVNVSAAACFWHLSLTIDFRPPCLGPLSGPMLVPTPLPCCLSLSLYLSLPHSLSCLALNFVRAQRQTGAASVTPPSLFLPNFPPSVKCSNFSPLISLSSLFTVLTLMSCPCPACTSVPVPCPRPSARVSPILAPFLFVFSHFGDLQRS